MLPQIIGPATFAPSHNAPSSTARVEQGAQPDVGETAAAWVRAETAERVDPLRVLPAVVALPGNRPRPETLLPPDPQAPVGPPPAFQATPLDRARKEALAFDRPPPVEKDAAPDRARVDKDEDLREKTEAEIAEVRRMSAPEPERSLDVLR